MTGLVENRPIYPGAPGTEEIGFTRDKFGGYLWRKGNDLWFSLIVSVKPSNGAVRDLINKSEAAGYRVLVPTPLGTMQSILEHYRFKPLMTAADDGEALEVWVRPDKTEPFES